ncbi:CCDC90 family protein [Candidatus Binatia bacterium]|nr:CCDC90 family protein [Candidatus Binatia bacterium]
MIALDTLAYARRLRQAGFSEQQAEGQAEALAAVMVDSLVTRPDLREMDLRIEARFAHIDERFARIDERFARIDERFEHLERKMDMRFAEQEARFDAKLADLERRLTMRLGGMMMAGIGAVSALVKLL